MENTETESIFGPLLEGRDCGGCRVCCEHLVVETPEFSKPAGTLCRHACAEGCSIYEDRFPVCRGWHCLWRHRADLPEAARPDRSGVMWGYAWSVGDHRRFQTRYVHGLCHAGEDAMQSAVNAAALEAFTTGDLPVWISQPGGEMRRVYPNEAEAETPEWDSGERRR